MIFSFSFPDLLRRYKKRYRIAAALKELDTRQTSGPSLGMPHGLPGPLVVSLTSHPARFPTLPLVLKSLLSQTIRPDKVILWISREDHAFLTDEILGFAAEGLEIAACEDLKSYNKIIHTLRRSSDCFVATADDDVYLWPQWLEELVLGLAADRRTIVCHRAHEIVLGNAGFPEPYGRWRKNVGAAPPSSLVFPTGVLGVLYPPHSFHPDVGRDTLFKELCPTADDIWLYWMFRLNGGTARKIGLPRRLVEWPGSQIVNLQQQNIAGFGNDIQLLKMAERYGFPH